MADGSSDECAGSQILSEITFSGPGTNVGDTKKCSGETYDNNKVKLSLYKERKASESCEKSDTCGVAAADRTAAAATETNFPKSYDAKTGDDGDDRKKRFFDRYDSSESSDSGVAVLSPTESGGCSSSDITEPGSPRSPESSCSTGEEVAARMPPWASDPPPGPRRLVAQPVPVRRPNPPLRRRITEYFNHKMKPQNGLKRDSNAAVNEDTKRKCLSKNGVSQDLEKYINYLSQTLSPKLLDVGNHVHTVTKKQTNTSNGALDNIKADLTKLPSSTSVNGVTDLTRSKDNKEIHMGVNGFLEVRKETDMCSKEKRSTGMLNGVIDAKKQGLEMKLPMKTHEDPSANGITNLRKHAGNSCSRKVPIPTASEVLGKRSTPTTFNGASSKKLHLNTDHLRTNGVVSSTTKLDSRMNGVTCGSNNISLSPITNKTDKKEQVKKQTTKRTNRKSSACIANSKNLTWSKANNLKQVQHKNSFYSKPTKITPCGTSATPKMNIPNGVRPAPMTANGNIKNINLPVPNLHHQINMPQVQQPCAGTVAPNNLASFVAVPPNVMLTALRIPQNGIPAQSLNQQNNLTAFNRPNVNVSSPTKLNGSFVFPLVQNINGTVVQLPNFILPQGPQITTQRQDHLQNQQAAQILINGTLLKLGNAMASSYSNVQKSMPVTSQSIPGLNKNMPSMQTVGMPVQSKPNYTVNFSHPVLVPQPGFIVTTVPNINVKETWCYSNTNTAPCSQTSCSNPIVQHPPHLVANFTAQTVHTSSIPIAPVKPPDNPIQGTDPPSSTVKEPDVSEITIPKCDVPWLSKTVNNNIVQLDTKILQSRPFAQVCSISEKLENISTKKSTAEAVIDQTCNADGKTTDEELRKIEEVERREETIFTQITVLKDVSSNVQNTVIETNFCSAVTESSESGLGTDKSIDSPSDSQTSKECDEDSSLSLSVSVCSVEVQNSQKSPILKQPKTLRFPPRNLIKNNSGNKRTSSTDTTSTVTLCLWENCKSEFENDSDLLVHLQSVHVESQAGKENYVCLWQQCKVRGKPSCSRLWLERHTQSHGGNKPFKCIVDGCERRFSTQILLERHVNNHFNESSPNTSGSKKSSDSAPKLIRRNGKKLRYRRQPWSARMFDFFDAGTMEGLVWRLARCTRWRLGGACPLREPPGRHTLTLHAACTATRYNAAEARREALITYYPPHVVEDEWVPEKEVRCVKRVEVAALPAHSKVVVYEQFCASYRSPASPPPAPRACASSRALASLLAKHKKPEPRDCNATYQPMLYKEEERAQVSGAKKRKLGRRHGGNAFWPCGR